MALRLFATVALLGDGAVLAASNGDGFDVALLLNYGVLGLVTLAWLTRRIVTGGELAAAEARAASAEARARALEDSIRADIVPAMVRFTDVGSRLAERP